MRNCWLNIQAAACEIEGVSQPQEEEQQAMDPSFYRSLLQDTDSEEESISGAAEGSNSQDHPRQRGSDWRTIFKRFYKVAGPYWVSEDRVQARLRLAVVLLLTLATTGISVSFSFVGRDFYSALANKDARLFKKRLVVYLMAFLGGIPVFVIRDHMRDLLAMRWRSWLTSHYIALYFENRTYYNIEAQFLMDNPDQRIISDVNSFTKTALDFVLAIFNAAVDLVCFSSILYAIYPPLFLVLLGYSVTGTVCSVLLGKCWNLADFKTKSNFIALLRTRLLWSRGMIGLTSTQEKSEADLRYGLLRIRENAESIAFYGGEKSEIQHLMRCLRQAMDNLTKLLAVSRNLNFFTTGYKYVIQLLPAAVVAPIYFSGKIDFGVISQSFAAFDHILSDLSIVVYQFQSITCFTAIVDRLGEFSDILATSEDTGEERAGLNAPLMADHARPRVNKVDVFECSSSSDPVTQTLPLLSVDHLTLHTPQYTMVLLENLTFAVHQGEHLLVMGPSGSGKTSLLRAIAGLWHSGRGTVRTYLRCCENELDNEELQVASEQSGVAESSEQGFSEIEEENAVERERDQWTGTMFFFLPQKPYMVQGSLRQQLLYPTWIADRSGDSTLVTILPMERGQPRCSQLRPPPMDRELYEVLARVKLSHLQNRCEGLDSYVEWATMLSQGEQQRIAFARLLLSRPRLAILDESTSAMDEENEVRKS